MVNLRSVIATQPTPGLTLFLKEIWISCQIFSAAIDHTVLVASQRAGNTSASVSNGMYEFIEELEMHGYVLRNNAISSLRGNRSRSAHRPAV